MMRAQEPDQWKRLFNSISLCAILSVIACDASGLNAQASAQLSSIPNSTEAEWTLSTPQFTNRFETEAFIGNGYLGLRVPAAGMGYLGNLGKVGWPIGTERIASAIAAGVYSKLSEGTFYKEPKQAIAFIPNWSTLTFGNSSGMYSPATVSEKNIGGYDQSLDLRTGVVTTSGVWTSPDGNKTRFVYRVGADRAHAHRAVLTLDLTPMWTGTATVGSVLDGAGARRLDLVASAVDAPSHSLHLSYKSIGTSIAVAESATLRSSCPLLPSKQNVQVPGSASETISFQAVAGKTCSFQKYVAVVTGRESKTPGADAQTEAKQAAEEGIAQFEKQNRAAWDEIWKSEIEIEGNPSLQLALRANEFSLFASIADHSPDSLGPSGLSSDGYAGMIFWDADTWMFPALLAQHPDLARVMVDYRSDTLPAAKKNAADNGYEGVLYPWTSGLTGDMGDECHGAITDANGKVIADPNKSCTQQLHLQSDVALAQWRYYESTGDKQWLAERGWPVIEAVAQFWVSKATPTAGGYAIDTVQTPDEYATDTNNDAYTNAAASLELKAAIEAAKILGKPAPEKWSQIANGLIRTMQIDPALHIYQEHEGYSGQKIKQADVVMLTYPLDFSMPKQVAIDDLNYYTPRTDVDGPAMTDAIHSIATAAVDAPGCAAYTYMVRSYQPFLREPYLQFSEFAPISLTATAYDFLTGVGGFMQEFLFGFSGYRPQPDAVRLDPNLPPQLAGITLRNLRWQGRTFTLHIGPEHATVTLNSGAPMPVMTPSGNKTAQPSIAFEVPTRRSDLQPTENVARCQPITSSSAVPGSPAVAAVDGLPATSWVAADRRATITIDLGKATLMAKLTVSRGSRAPFPYNVQISSDKVHWKTVATAPATAEGGGAGTDTLTFLPVTAQFLRLDFPGAEGAKPPNIAEIEVVSKAN